MTKSSRTGVKVHGGRELLNAVAVAALRNTCGRWKTRGEEWQLSARSGLSKFIYLSAMPTFTSWGSPQRSDKTWARRVVWVGGA
jgi:hypothetical protein